MADTAVRLPRAFWAYFAASAVSWFGDGVIVVGFPLLAAALTRSPLWIAVVVVTQRVAPMLLGLPAGALADRWDARRTAVCTDLAQTALFGVSALLISAGHFDLPALIVVSFLADALGTLFSCADGALVADVVEPRHFPKALATIRASHTVIAFVIGPGLGGLLFAIGHGLPLLIDAASFLLAAGLLATLRLPGARPKPEAAARHFGTEIKEGVRIVFGQPAVRLMAVVSGAMALAQAGSVAVIVVLGTHTVGLGKGAFGWTLAAGNITAVVAMLYVGWISRLRTSTAVAAGLGVGAIGELLLGTATSAPQMAAGLAMDATAALVIGLTMTTARLRLVARELLGRMTGGYQTLLYAAGAVGTILGGWLALISPRIPYLACAAAYALLLAAVFRRLGTLDEVPDVAGAEPAGVGVVVAPAEAPAAESVTAVNGSIATQTADGSAA